jgi:hypothetical protein
VGVRGRQQLQPEPRSAWAIAPKMADVWRGVQHPCLSMCSLATISPHFFSFFLGCIKAVIHIGKLPSQCYIFGNTGVEGTSQNGNRQTSGSRRGR